MGKLRLFIGACVVLGTLHLDAQCTWVEQTGQIVQDCGKVGIGLLSPWTGLHVKGSGQTASNPELTSSSQNGSVLFLQDSGGAAGNGGMIGFGAQHGSFAAIKGSADGTVNPLGDLIFATRNAGTETALTERMRILANGIVTIGRRLYVTDLFDGGTALNAKHNTIVEANANQTDWGANFSVNQDVQTGVTNSGRAIGSQSSAYQNGSGVLAAIVGQQIYAGVQPSASGSVTTAYGSIITLISGGGSIGTGHGLYIDDVPATIGYGVYQGGGNDGNYFAGKVGIGTLPTANALEVVGNANFQGTVTGTNIQAKYQDVAEWVSSAEDLAPGTVVVLDPSVNNAVVKSTSAYDTSVAGVVSAQPGIILGEGGPAKEQVATTGRVRVKVDASMTPIRIGDLLVTSGKPGVAMRSEAIELAGRRLHQPGTIIGKALEALPKGEGEILVLLSLQ